MDRYDDVAKSFSEFFGAEHLRVSFAEKASVGELTRLKDEKASKTDLQKINLTIEAVYDRLKHISILQSELAKSILPAKASGSFKATENINTTLQRRDFIAKQT